jgi:hypothetical protein
MLEVLPTQEKQRPDRAEAENTIRKKAAGFDQRLVQLPNCLSEFSPLQLINATPHHRRCRE